jgi:predicted nucleic acid-binding protein
VIVVDSSAWIELFRRTGSPVHLALRRLLRDRAPLAVTEIVVMELLAGAARPAEAAHYLRSFTMLPLRGLRDFEYAAVLFRACQAAGETLREMTDCLVAVPTIRTGATLLHSDGDFEKLARHTPLEVLPV